LDDVFRDELQSREQYSNPGDHEHHTAVVKPALKTAYICPVHMCERFNRPQCQKLVADNCLHNTRVRNTTGFMSLYIIRSVTDNSADCWRMYLDSLRVWNVSLIVSLKLPVHE